MHAISPVRSRDRSQSEQLQRDFEQLQAELTQVRAERDRLQEQLAQALEQVAALSSQTAPRTAEIEEASRTAEIEEALPELPEQSLSRIVVSTYPAADSSEAERRQVARLGSEFEVEFLDDTHLISGLTQDISQGGLFVATYQSLPLGSLITLALELPGGRIEVQGEVRWARPECEALEQRPGFGVAFTQLSPEALVALTALCRSRPPLYYDS